MIYGIYAFHLFDKHEQLLDKIIKSLTYSLKQNIWNN
jgi:hypothetical protein